MKSSRRSAVESAINEAKPDERPTCWMCAEGAAKDGAEIERLRTDYEDSSLDRDELLQFAIDHEIPNLEAAYTYRKTLSEREAKRADAKRSAPPIETRGSNQANTSAVTEDPISSIEEAVRSAMKELGVESLTDLA